MQDKWTAAEDRILVKAADMHHNGRKQVAWKAVEKVLKSAGFQRTANEARSRYSRIKLQKNRCSVCGKLRVAHKCAVPRSPFESLLLELEDDQPVPYETSRMLDTTGMPMLGIVPEVWW